EAAVDGQTAAVLVEPIQSIGGARVAPAEFYSAAREISKSRGALLIFDELQTGLGRTGRFFVGEHWGVAPDVITLAKGLASGEPNVLRLLPPLVLKEEEVDFFLAVLVEILGHRES